MAHAAMEHDEHVGSLLRSPEAVVNVIVVGHPVGVHCLRFTPGSARGPAGQSPALRPGFGAGYLQPFGRDLGVRASQIEGTTATPLQAGTHRFALYESRAIRPLLRDKLIACGCR